MKTLKRDYVQVTPSPDAETILRLIGSWVADYNDNQPLRTKNALAPRVHCCSSRNRLSVR